jgi:hypothetical protein
MLNSEFLDKHLRTCVFLFPIVSTLYIILGIYLIYDEMEIGLVEGYALAIGFVSSLISGVLFFRLRFKSWRILSISPRDH